MYDIDNADVRVLHISVYVPYRRDHAVRLQCEVPRHLLGWFHPISCLDDPFRAHARHKSPLQELEEQLQVGQRGTSRMGSPGTVGGWWLVGGGWDKQYPPAGNASTGLQRLHSAVHALRHFDCVDLAMRSTSKELARSELWDVQSLWNIRSHNVPYIPFNLGPEEFVSTNPHGMIPVALNPTQDQAHEANVCTAMVHTALNPCLSPGARCQELPPLGAAWKGVTSCGRRPNLKAPDR